MQHIPEVTTNASGGVAINGPLTLATVANLLRRHPSIADGNGNGDGDAGAQVTVDLGAVSHVDSAGLALLVEWDSVARQGGAPLRFTSAPAALQSLARVAGVGQRFA